MYDRWFRQEGHLFRSSLTRQRPLTLENMGNPISRSEKGLTDQTVKIEGRGVESHQTVNICCSCTCTDLQGAIELERGPLPTQHVIFSFWSTKIARD